MSMTRKHYVEVAKILATKHEEWSTRDNFAIQSVALEFAAWFAEDNPRFDRDRFLTAAGYGYTST